MGGLDDTSVLRLAVAELFHRKQAEWKARLIPQPDGAYDLQVHGLTLARVGKQALAGLPGEVGENLLAAEADGISALTLLLLGAAAAGEKVWIDDQGLESLVEGEQDLGGDP
jgi:hypothetical protein